jgi:hypothetical protein
MLIWVQWRYKMQLNHVDCCGVREIAALGAHRSPLEALRSFRARITETGNNRFRYAFFTQANVTDTTGKDQFGADYTERRRLYGEKFAAYIVKNKLGTVIKTEDNVNPNSGRFVKMWVWTIDHPAVIRHLDKQVRRKRVARGSGS